MSQRYQSTIPKELVGPAKQLVAKWFDESGQLPANVRRKMLSGVESIAAELPRRANWIEVRTLALNQGKGLKLRLRGMKVRALPCASCLAVTSVAPGWGTGWKNVLKNPEVYDVLSWFLHYTRQYVHRSNVAIVLMECWEQNKKHLPMFGDNQFIRYYGPMLAVPAIPMALDFAERVARQEWGKIRSPKVTNSHWIERNLLDPNLHQGVFHFLRGENLVINGFDLEAVIAFDCVVQAATAFLSARTGFETSPSRSETCTMLGLADTELEAAEYAYFIRNAVGAHVGGWRWWDHGELLDGEQLDEIRDMAYRVLIATSELEKQQRLIDPAPEDWSMWFFQNFGQLWESVWFKLFSAPQVPQAAAPPR